MTAAGTQPGRALRALGTAGLAALLVAGLTACGGSSSSSSSPGSSSAPSAGAGQASATVQVASFSYAPPTVTIKAGGTVTWRNSDPYPHTASVAAGGQGPALFTTGTLRQSQSKTVSFTKPGIYSYVCLFHQFMHATVVVR